MSFFYRHRRDLETIERTHKCISEEDLKNSYVYASFENDLSIPIPTHTEPIIQKKFVPGLNMFKRIPNKSELDTKQQARLLSALKIYQSGQVNLNEMQKANLELYNVR